MPENTGGGRERVRRRMHHRRGSRRRDRQARPLPPGPPLLPLGYSPAQPKAVKIPPPNLGSDARRLGWISQSEQRAGRRRTRVSTEPKGGRLCRPATSEHDDFHRAATGRGAPARRACSRRRPLHGTPARTRAEGDRAGVTTWTEVPSEAQRVLHDDAASMPIPNSPGSSGWSNRSVNPAELTSLTVIFAVKPVVAGTDTGRAPVSVAEFADTAASGRGSSRTAACSSGSATPNWASRRAPR